MSIFVNRDGDISIFRVGIFILAIGFIIGLGGFVLFQLEQNRFNTPLNIDSYSNSTELGIRTLGDTERVVIYTIPNASVEDVMEHYELEIAEFYDVDPNDLEAMLRRPTDERCNRFPTTGIAEDYVEGSGNLQYYFSCMFSDSQYDSERWTEVRIMPGVLTLADDGQVLENTLGVARVEYHQYWR